MEDPMHLQRVDIERYRITEKPLVETEEIFRLLVSSIENYAIFALDYEGHILTWNSGAEQLKGYKAEEVIGTHFSRFYTSEEITKQHPIENLKIAEIHGKYEGEGWRVRKDGSWFWAKVMIRVLKDSNGNLRGFAKITQDLTERKNAEQARLNEKRQTAILEKLRENVDLLRAITTASPDFVFAKDDQGKVIFANPSVFQVLGKPESEILSHTAIEFFGKKWGSLIMENDRQVICSGQPAVVKEKWVIHGKLKTYISNKVPYRGKNQEIIGLISISRNLTDLRKLCEELEKSELQYRTLLETIPQLIWRSLPDGQCDYFSKQWVEYTGIQEEEQLGLHWLAKSIHPEDQNRTFEHWMGAIHGLHPYDIEYRIRRKDGIYRWFKARATPIRNSLGEVTCWFGTCTDIEDQRHSFEVLKTINEMGRILSAELDLTRLVQTVTHAATKLSGAESAAFFYNVSNKKEKYYQLYTLSGASNQVFSHFPMPKHLESFNPIFDNKVTFRSVDLQQDARFEKRPPYSEIPLGHLPVISYLAVPVISRSGEVLGGLVLGHSKANMFSDQEEELVKGLAAQAAIALDNAKLYQQSKDAIQLRDDFLSIASHELKTPLTAMKIQTEMFYKKLAKSSTEALNPDSTLRLVNRMDRGLNRLIRLVSDMIDISQIQIGKFSIHPTPLPIESVIQEAMEQLQSEFSNACIELKMKLSPGLIALLDRSRFKQVITNLSINAIRYAPNNPILLTLNRKGNFAEIRFQDHGPGIPKADREKIFEPFERLVSADEVSGMGLGLYISKEIIEAHQGIIRVDSENCSGACFIIELPIAEKKLSVKC